MAVDNLLHKLHRIPILAAVMENLSPTPCRCYRRVLVVS